MKNRWFIIFFSIIFISCGREFNDWDEYGLKGEVKSVKTTIYKGLEKKNDKYILNSDKITQSSTIKFTTNGQIESVEGYSMYEDDKYEWRSQFEYESGRKVKSTHTDLFTNETNVQEFNWIDDYTYEIVDTTNGSFKVKHHYELSKTNGRDLKGNTKGWKKGELIVDESYENILEGSKVVKSIITDNIENISTTFSVTYISEDAQGNATEYFIYNETDGELKEYRVREISYY